MKAMGFALIVLGSVAFFVYGLGLFIMVITGNGRKAILWPYHLFFEKRRYEGERQ